MKIQEDNVQLRYVHIYIHICYLVCKQSTIRYLLYTSIIDNNENKRNVYSISAFH